MHNHSTTVNNKCHRSHNAVATDIPYIFPTYATQQLIDPTDYNGVATAGYIILHLKSGGLIK